MDAYLVAYFDFTDVHIDSVWTSWDGAFHRLEEIRAKADRYEIEWDIVNVPLDREGYR